MKKNDVRFVQWLWKEELQKMLEPYGFKSVGEGVHGFVAVPADLPGYPYALKVFKNDRGYIRWYDFCKKNQHNSLVPKFKGKMINLVSDVYYVRMEKLFPIQSYNDPAFQTDLGKEVRIFERYLYQIRMHEFETTGHQDLDDILHEFTRVQGRVQMDLHVFNHMKRADGSLVIIDPYME